MDRKDLRTKLVDNYVNSPYATHYTLALELGSYIQKCEVVRDKYDYSALPWIMSGEFVTRIKEYNHAKDTLLVNINQVEDNRVQDVDVEFEIDVEKFINGITNEEECKKLEIEKIDKQMERLMIKLGKLQERKERLENGLGIV